MSATRIEPDLARALDDTASSGPLNVFAKMRLPNAATHEDWAAQIRDMVQRVQKLVGGATPPKFNYRALDQTLHVMAEPRFIKKLSEQPEVVAVSAVPTFRSAMIAPIDVKPVGEDAIDRPVARKHVGARSRGPGARVRTRTRR